MSEPPWWQKTVIYEIYPRSFQDGDGDGVGDLKGIVERIDYLSWLGVDAVWICPIYPSPMRPTCLGSHHRLAHRVTIALVPGFRAASSGRGWPLAISSDRMLL